MGLGAQARRASHGRRAPAREAAKRSPLSATRSKAAWARKAMRPPAACCPPAPSLATLSADGALAGVTASPGLAIGSAPLSASPKIAVAPRAADRDRGTDALDAAAPHCPHALARRRRRAATPNVRSSKRTSRFSTTRPDRCRGDGIAGGAQRRPWLARARSDAKPGVLRGSGDARFAERADDLQDLERQVLLALAGGEPEAPLALPAGHHPARGRAAALAADGARSRAVVGICVERAARPRTSRSSPPSSACRCWSRSALRWPRSRRARRWCSTPAAACSTSRPDASAGDARQRPSTGRPPRGRARRRARACRTADGTRIEVFANLGSRRRCGARRRATAPKAAGCCAPNSCSSTATARPSEEEQRAAYQAIADALGGPPADRPHCSISAATSPRPICRSRPRRTRRWACAASASASRIRNCSTRRSARSCRRAARRSAGSWCR